jgi:hypothetical protein
MARRPPDCGVSLKGAIPPAFSWGSRPTRKSGMNLGLTIELTCVRRLA